MGVRYLVAARCALIMLVTCLLAKSAARAQPSAPSAPMGRLTFRIQSPAGEWMPCRIHLKDASGQAHFPEELPRWHDHFVCPGQARLLVPAGDYRYEIERGPEWNRIAAAVEVQADQTSVVDHVLERFADLRAEGWRGGDLHVHRPVEQMPMMMEAEDLDFAPVITWWNQRNLWSDQGPPDEVTIHLQNDRVMNVMAGEDEREGGALLYFGLPKPLEMQGAEREFPSPLKYVQQARDQKIPVWIDIEKPFWWDVPVWLSTGKMNSIGLANNHMCRDQMLENEAWGRPRDVSRLPNPTGNGEWSQEIYYRLLDAGLRLPPSAGSASGVLPNPVGYNRVYVQMDHAPLSRESFFSALAAGRCFVTNGPLLRVKANGRWPGLRLSESTDEIQRIDLEVQVSSQDRLKSVQVIYNGRVVHSQPCSGDPHQRFRIQLNVRQPGWFLVRAITDVEHTFRFASTGPWFVEAADDSRRISLTAVEFFLDWVDERIERVKQNLPEGPRRDEVLVSHLEAKQFWEAQLEAANAP